MNLDLMSLHDCNSPRKLVGELIRQLEPLQIPIPIHEIATSCGIHDVLVEDLRGAAGVLAANADRSAGVISVARASSPRRRRFTIGHELGHFLIRGHSSTISCAEKALYAEYHRSSGIDVEGEANQVAAGLLLPEREYRQALRQAGAPDLEKLLTTTNQFEVSLAAACLRFVELTDFICAVVFSHKGVVRYVVKSRDFPWIEAGPGRPVPRGTLSAIFDGLDGDISDFDVAGSGAWTSAPPRAVELFEQVYVQQNDHRVTLLQLEDVPDDSGDDDEENGEVNVPHFH